MAARMAILLQMSWEVEGQEVQVEDPGVQAGGREVQTNQVAAECLEVVPV